MAGTFRDGIFSASHVPKQKLATVVVVLALAFGVALAVNYGTSRFFVRQAEEEIQHILLSHRGLHRYVQSVMHPAFFEAREQGYISKDFYAPQLFSSTYSVRVQHGFYNEELERYGNSPVYYKLAADNPRNPVNKADERESRLLKMFNADRSLKEWREIAMIGGKNYLTYSAPFLINDKPCLKCHGKREDAPPGLLAMYPGEGGFNEKIGVFRAIESVRAPIDNELHTAYVITAFFTMILLSFFLLGSFNSRLKSVVSNRTRDLQREIAEKKRAEDDLRQLNQQLEQKVEERTGELRRANKELEMFSYSVSHDLRAPLRHIDGFSQCLLEDYSDKLDDEGRRHLQKISAGSRQMDRLINDLLQFSRVARVELSTLPADLSELAKESAAMLRETDPDRSARFEIEDAVVVEGDKNLLKIALQNMLDNAWKYSANNPQAVIAFGRATVDGKEAFFVRDNGAGFDMAYYDKLFGVFQRLHGGEFPGTGIGLASAKRIIVRHGGTIWAEGVVGAGATFWFTLPGRGKERE